MQNKVFLFVWIAIAVAINIWLISSVVRNRNLVRRKAFRTIFFVTLGFFGLSLLAFAIHEAFLLLAFPAFFCMVLTAFVLRFYCVECGQPVGSMRRISLCEVCKPKYYRT